MLAAAAVLASCGGTACSQRELPAYGEALFIVDTDLPPTIAGRMRVDVYDANGNWYQSRAIAVPDADSWPLSFSIYDPDTSQDRQALVRIRVYPDDITRDYLGERFVDNGQTKPPAGGPGPSDTNPRLIENGTDVTPASEPLPSVTVDQLVLVRLHLGTKGSVRVVMHGDCAGTMAMLTQTPPFQTPDVTQAATCVDTEAQRVPVSEQTLDPDMTIPKSSPLLGTFGTEDTCDPTLPADPRAVCIPSGVFVMGSPAVNLTGPPTDGTPQRLAVVDRFWLDRYEVTVAQIRQAQTEGILKGPLHVADHEGPLGKPAASDVEAQDMWCTWSAAPMGRENYAITCTSWLDLARPYCQGLGGDLPTEAQWEYAATAAGNVGKTTYPWGDGDPTCGIAVYGRSDDTMLPLGGDPTCATAEGIGPRPVTAAPTDVTTLGVFGMGGGVYEWAQDSSADYASACWAAQPLHNPVCQDPKTIYRIFRSGSWFVGGYSLNGAFRSDADGTIIIEQVGFRCAFPKAPNRP
jgi:formylglycine-generating enzyme required for sulfatase activity